MSIIKIGIECENLEDINSRWGVGQITLNLLEEYSKNAEWQKKYKFYLYFKKRIPDDEVFKNPIFVKRVLNVSSFNIFYHIFLPLRAMKDGLDWMFFPAYMLPPLYLGKSIVMLTDDVHHEYKYGNLPFRYKLAYRLFTNWAAVRANKILAISETSKKEVAKSYGINPEKIFVSYLGVNSPAHKDPAPATGYLLYVGQMFPRRHARETILAFKKLITEHSHILENVRMSGLKLILVGKDKYAPPVIQKLVEDTNRELGSERVIHYDYIEKREDIEKLYAGAKALVYISDREAFGLPPMEALSFGVPPVIMDNELGHELFDDYAFYSEGGTFDNVAKAIKKSLTDEEKIRKIKNSGPEFVKKYNWKSFADKFLKNAENKPS